MFTISEDPVEGGDMPELNDLINAGATANSDIVEGEGNNENSVSVREMVNGSL